MRLLRYIASIYAAAIGVVMAVVLILVLSVTMIESTDYIARAEAGAWTVVRMLALTAVEQGFLMLPLAVFLAALVAGTMLARSGELLAAQAAGVRPRRMMLAFVGVAVGTGILGAGCGEYAVPPAVQALKALKRDELGRGDPARHWLTKAQWFRFGDLMLYLPFLDAKTGSFPGATVYTLEDGLIVESTDTQSLSYDEGWILTEAYTISVDAKRLNYEPTKRLELPISAQELFDIATDPRELSSQKLSELIKRRESVGFASEKHMIEWHSRWAIPVSAIWMFLLVAPWALDPSRRRSMAVALGYGVAVISLYFVVGHTFRVMALGHAVAPWMGAWGVAVASLLAAPVSFYLYSIYRVRGSVFPWH